MPQPIDPASELGRITAAERVQMTLDRAAQMAQLRGLAEATQDSARQQEQVRQADQKDTQLEEEARRRNPYLMVVKKRSDGDGGESAESYDAKQRKQHPDDGEHLLDVTL